MDNNVFCVDTGGTTYVLAGGPEFEVRDTNKIDEMTWSTPSVANDSVYFRTASRLYRITER